MWPLLALTAVAGLGALGYGVGGRSSQMFGRSVYCGSGRRKSIALTFDDGPSESTLDVLEYLARYSLPATFFQCGLNVEWHPAIARAVAEAGHEVGNHTYAHSRLSPRLAWPPNFLGPKTIYKEFARAQEIIVRETGKRPQLLRAPYGLRWFGVRAAQERLRLLGVMWTVIGRDWELPAGAIAQRVLTKATPGGIICLHDGRDIQAHPDVRPMLAALKTIVPELLDHGYAFETVSNLIAR